ncbi:dTDP-glucose 4,6-dehydratase [Candidatus Poribacteria bacterium]|nr:dTDP-glucose 4,6-dehydratase [Candidatus Poribacteria bacterium]
MRLLVTGGAGFIGSNFIRYWLEKYGEDEIFNLDLLTYAGNLENLAGLDDAYGRRYGFTLGSITVTDFVDRLFSQFKPDVIVNFAAESHNSRAILNPTIFFQTNLIGTQTLLDVAQKYEISRFHHVSTCEIYGDLPLNSAETFSEQTSYRPNTPYSASKAGADLAVLAYHQTFGLPVTISVCCNNYGPYQNIEKLIPLFISKAICNQPLTLYKSSQNKREWLAVEDHCRAIDLIIRQGKSGERYNVGSQTEKSVEEIADSILQILGKPQSLKTYVPDRPGHDRRYLLDSRKIQQELGWKLETDFETGLKNTVGWYINHRQWWQQSQSSQIREDRWGK